mgnify:CR=1 FL=1
MNRMVTLLLTALGTLLNECHLFKLIRTLRDNLVENVRSPLSGEVKNLSGVCAEYVRRRDHPNNPENQP